MFDGLTMVMKVSETLGMEYILLRESLGKIENKLLLF